MLSLVNSAAFVILQFLSVSSDRFVFTPIVFYNFFFQSSKPSLGAFFQDFGSGSFWWTSKDSARFFREMRLTAKDKGVNLKPRHSIYFIIYLYIQLCWLFIHLLSLFLFQINLLLWNAVCSYFHITLFLQ